MKNIIVNENEAGRRLDKLIFKYLNRSSAGFVYKMLRKKNITLNGKKATGNEMLVKGDEIKIFISDETFNKFSDIFNSSNTDEFAELSEYAHKLEVVYEDEHIILMNKPKGILSQKADKDDISINEIMLAYLFKTGQITDDSLKTFKPSVCNRLDRNTSGLIAGGKSLKGSQELSVIFKERHADKFYVCVVNGIIKDKAKISGYILKDKSINKVMIYNTPKEGASYIKTEYYPIVHNQNNTLLAVKLITGRAHQIRAHLASIDCPIIGDYKYGRKKINDYYKDKYGINSQMLHSYFMKFNISKGALEYLNNKSFYAPLPEWFLDVIYDEFEEKM